MEGMIQHKEQNNAAESSDKSSAAPSFLDDFARIGMIKIDEGNKEHDTIRKDFLSGMGQLRQGTTVVAVHGNKYSSVSARARLLSYWVFSRAVAEKNGGNANAMQGWYGASREEVCEIISHGFSRPRPFLNGAHGVLLTPQIFSANAIPYSAPDETGLRHLLLCRVLMGRMEVIPPGSTQSSPSPDFDSVVDSLLAPKCYFVWSTNMNSHILPAYIISFTISSIPNLERRLPQQNLRLVTLCMLIPKLSEFISPSAMSVIRGYYASFQTNKINRMQFIRRLRRVAGDEVIVAVVKAQGKKVNASVGMEIMCGTAAKEGNKEKLDAAQHK